MERVSETGSLGHTMTSSQDEWQVQHLCWQVAKSAEGSECAGSACIFLLVWMNVSTEAALRKAIVSAGKGRGSDRDLEVFFFSQQVDIFFWRGFNASNSEALGGTSMLMDLQVLWKAEITGQTQRVMTAVVIMIEVAGNFQLPSLMQKWRLVMLAKHWSYRKSPFFPVGKRCSRGTALQLVN